MRLLRLILDPTHCRDRKQVSEPLKDSVPPGRLQISCEVLYSSSVGLTTGVGHSDLLAQKYEEKLRASHLENVSILNKEQQSSGWWVIRPKDLESECGTGRRAITLTGQ